MTEQMRELLNLVEVERVSMTRDRSSVRVFIVSPRLIDKRNIWDLERGICEQLFPGKRITVRLFEKYRLSGQYTPEKLLKVYRDSLLAELKSYSIIEYAIFRKAQCSFPRPDVLHMTVEDTMVNRDKAGELKRVLEKVFHERCGLPVEVEYEYVPPVRTKASAAGQLKEKIEAPRITGQAETSTMPRGGRKESKKNEWSAGGGRRKSDNPDLLYGRDFEDDFIEIEKIEGEIGEVTIRGKILGKDSRPLRSGKTIIIFHITDFTDTITVKIFANEDTFDELDRAVTEGSFIRLRGMTTIDRFDGELTIGSVRGIKKSEDFTCKRMDNSPVKRVELHCHTKMSDMDGVSEVADIVKRAKAWGMPAIAVTDHGCVQAFPDAVQSPDVLRKLLCFFPDRLRPRTDLLYCLVQSKVLCSRLPIKPRNALFHPSAQL